MHPEHAPLLHRNERSKSQVNILHMLRITMRFNSAICRDKLKGVKYKPTPIELQNYNPSNEMNIYCPVLINQGLNVEHDRNVQHALTRRYIPKFYAIRSYWVAAHGMNTQMKQSHMPFGTSEPITQANDPPSCKQRQIITMNKQYQDTMGPKV